MRSGLISRRCRLGEIRGLKELDMSDDAFVAALALLAAAGDPKASASRIKELRAAFAENEAAQRKLVADRVAWSESLAAQKAAFDAECAERRASLEKAEETWRAVKAQLEAAKRQFADRLEAADRVLDRYEGYWRARLSIEPPGAAHLASVPSFWRDEDPAPADAHFGRDEGHSSGAEYVSEGNTGDQFPTAVSLTRARPHRRAEAQSDGGRG
jgi:hypothetical protein